MKKLFFLFSISVSTTFAQGDCGNVGFESGSTQGWTCRSGIFAGTFNSGICADNVLAVSLTATGCLSGGTDDTNDPPSGQEDKYRHTIMSNTAATDPNSLNNITCVAPASLFPAGVNKYSFRIGNAVGTKSGQTEAFAESIKYSFTVSKDNAGLTYLYSAFLNDPNHPKTEAPRFEIKIFILKNGKEELIDCGYYKVEAGGTGAEFLDGKSTGTATWKYTKWTKVGLDLSGYMNQNITIEFTTADCYPSTANLLDKTKCTWMPGEHSAYAYIDLYCTPVEIISPPVCANQASVELCAPPGYATYDWPANQPGIQPPLNKQCVTINKPKAGSVYVVNMKSVAGGCPTSTKITLKGSDFTVKDAAVCDGGAPVKLTATPTTAGDYTFKWEPKVNLDCYDCQSPTFTPGTTTTYTVTMTDKNVANCDQVKQVKVTVGASFTVETAGTTICEGANTTLTATGADTYSWKDPSGNIYTGATIQVSPVVTTTYTVTGTSASAACPGNPDATATVVVNQKPIVEVADLTACIGEKIKLNGKISGGATNGAWVGGSGKFIPNRAALDATYIPSATEETAGTVTLTLESEDPDGPCGKEQKTMTITIVPAVTADAGPDQTICIGDFVKLDGKFGGAATGGSWSGGTGTFEPANNDPKAAYTPSVAEIAAGKVTLKFTVTNGSNATCPGGADFMTIFIDKMPTVSAGADQTICFGEVAALGGSIGGTATSAVWTGGMGTFIPNNTTLTAKYKPSPAEMLNGTVVLTLTTNAPGKCPAKDSKTTITINPLAVVDAGPHVKICVGGAVPLAGVINGGAVSGTWSGGTGSFMPDNKTAAAIYTPSKTEETAGKVILKFTTNDPPGPCPAVEDTMSISIDQLPVAIAKAPPYICAGAPIQLNGKVLGAATEGTWSGGDGGYSKNYKDLNAVYTPAPKEIAAGKVTLILTTNATGLCPIAKDSVTIIIHPNPVIKFAVDTPKACPPHCVDFFDSTTAGSTNITKWEWDFGLGNAVPHSNLTNPKEICYYKPGFYDVTLTATSDKGCKTTLTKQEMIQTYPVPVANFSADPNPVSLYDPTIHFIDQSSADVTSWIWNLGDGKIISPNVRNPVHKYEVGISGVYQVKLFVINANGCVDSTIHPVEVLPEFTFYIPNAFTPSSSTGVNDTFFGKGVGIIQYHIWIFDRWGNMVFDTTDINHGWDGRANKGVDIAQQDVFVWKVVLTDIFGKRHDYIGTVTLVK
jgi:PKD repeat protein